VMITIHSSPIFPPPPTTTTTTTTSAGMVHGSLLVIRSQLETFNGVSKLFKDEGYESICEKVSAVVVVAVVVIVVGVVVGES